MFILRIRRICPGLHWIILTPVRLQALRTMDRCFSLMIWSPLTVRGCRPSVVAVVEVRMHFSCPKMFNRLLYQNEAEQLVLERGLVVAEPEVPFFRSFRGLWSPGYLKVHVVCLITDLTHSRRLACFLLLCQDNDVFTQSFILISDLF